MVVVGKRLRNSIWVILEHFHISFAFVSSVTNLWFVICDDPNMGTLFLSWLDTIFWCTEDRMVSAHPQVLINLWHLKWRPLLILQAPLPRWSDVTSCRAPLEPLAWLVVAPPLLRPCRRLQSADTCIDCRAIASRCIVASCASCEIWECSNNWFTSN